MALKFYLSFRKILTSTKKIVRVPCHLPGALKCDLKYYSAIRKPDIFVPSDELVKFKVFYNNKLIFTFCETASDLGEYKVLTNTVRKKLTPPDLVQNPTFTIKMIVPKSRKKTLKTCEFFVKLQFSFQ